MADPTHSGNTKFRLYDAGTEIGLDVDLEDFVDMDGIEGTNIVLEYFEQIDLVEWVVNGKLEYTRHEHPFSIAGSQPADSPSGHNLFDWQYPVFD